MHTHTRHMYLITYTCCSLCKVNASCDVISRRRRAGVTCAKQKATWNGVVCESPSRSADRDHHKQQAARLSVCLCGVEMMITVLTVARRSVGMERLLITAHQWSCSGGRILLTSSPMELFRRTDLTDELTVDCYCRNYPDSHLQKQLFSLTAVVDWNSLEDSTLSTETVGRFRFSVLSSPV